MVRRLLGVSGMLHSTLRELRALPPAHPARGLAFAMLLTSIVIVGA